MSGNAGKVYHATYKTTEEVKYLLNSSPKQNSDKSLNSFSTECNSSLDSSKNSSIEEESIAVIENKAGSSVVIHNGPYSMANGNNLRQILFVCLFGAIAVLFSFSVISSFQNMVSKPINPPKETCAEFFDLKSEYPDQSDDLWSFLQVGVESVLFRKPTKPTVFMLVHKSGTHKSKLIKSIVNVAYQCLGNTERPLLLTHRDLMRPDFEKDYGNAIALYHESFMNSGIILVENFDMVRKKYNTSIMCKYVNNKIFFLMF